jgi:hypothetical protein
MKMIVQWMSLALALSVTAGEQYSFDFTERFGNKKSPSVVRTGDEFTAIRMLQSNDNAEPCYFSGDRLVCEYSFVAGPTANETSITFQARCDINAQYGFDYRQATNCACSARVTPAVGSPKNCPCAICAANLGETPVSVDCSVHEEAPPGNITSTSRAENITDDDVTGSVSIDDSVAIPASNVTITATNTNDTNATNSISPFIFAECSSIDCFGACNGTCSLNCNDPSGNVCPYCETYTGSGATTSAPTGSGNDNIGQLGEPPQSTPTSDASYDITSVSELCVAIAILSTFWM